MEIRLKYARNELLFIFLSPIISSPCQSTEVCQKNVRGFLSMAKTFVACSHLHSMFRFDTTLRSLIESKLLLGNSDPDSELGRILGLPLYSLKFAPWRRSSGG